MWIFLMSIFSEIHVRSLFCEKKAQHFATKKWISFAKLVWLFGYPVFLGYHFVLSFLSCRLQRLPIYLNIRGDCQFVQFKQEQYGGIGPSSGGTVYRSGLYTDIPKKGPKKGRSRKIQLRKQVFFTCFSLSLHNCIFRPTSDNMSRSLFQIIQFWCI